MLNKRSTGALDGKLVFKNKIKNSALMVGKSAKEATSGDLSFKNMFSSELRLAC